jgi:phosphomannomutase
MNDLVILQTVQGLVKYLFETISEDELKHRGVIIGYDHRQKGQLSSSSFARIAAAVIISQNIKVYWLEDFVPTPFVAFGTKYYNCAAGNLFHNKLHE